MAFYQFIQTQKIPAPIDIVWDFFSDPANLKDITPEHLAFRVTGSSGDSMYPGMIITYIVKPVLGVPVKWMTEITQVAPKKYFIDEQRMGPYKLWHHQHHFEEVEGGVLMKDIVTYIPPLGFVGAIANTLFIKNALRKIFDYRSKVVENIFG